MISLIVSSKFTLLKSIYVPEESLLELDTRKTACAAGGKILYYYKFMDSSYTSYGLSLEVKMKQATMNFSDMISKTRMFETAFVEIMFGQLVFYGFLR